MLDKIISVIAPHLCLNCRRMGTLLCQSCAKNINEVSFLQCFLCLGNARKGVCTSCSMSQGISQAWLIGKREGLLKELVDVYKFERAKAAYQPLARLLSEKLPILPGDTSIVPVPTASAHIRERGYDHIELIAKELARLRKLRYAPLLGRASSATQRSASKLQRQQQAATAFRCVREPEPGRQYLLIDDIVTTGATMSAASKCLKAAGATEVVVAAIARQMLDDLV